MSVSCPFVIGERWRLLEGRGFMVAHLYADGRAKGDFEPPLGALGEADLRGRGGGELAVRRGLC